MNTHPSVAILPFLLFLVAATTGFGQPSSKEQISTPDSGTFFLYVNYCGNHYNRVTRGNEMVINILKLPGNLLEKMPRLEDDGQYSSRNRKISMKQQKIIRKVNGERMMVRVNRNKFNVFYPKGLKRGFIIESDEFNRWNFQEKEPPVLAPPNNPERNNIDWYWYEADLVMEDLAPMGLYVENGRQLRQMNTRKGKTNFTCDIIRPYHADGILFSQRSGGICQPKRKRYIG
ncbi:MAG: hypothetical protein NT040_18580 [Bacteroidetes bacterium]|nr:hypothetical protein [Bacteroidota bacterium]